MRQFYGANERGNLREAVRGLKNPQFVMLMTSADDFDRHVAELESLYPGVPSIGCIGQGYQARVSNGVSVVGLYDGVKAETGVLEQASVMPMKYIGRVDEALSKVNGTGADTVCIDFCSGNDACVLTTLHSVLRPKGISLVGGTGDGGRVAVNGTIYEDAVAFALIRNLTGRVRAYKENIYHQYGDHRFVASKTDRSRYIVGALNGRPAREVYEKTLGVTEGEDLLQRTLRNPLGKMDGEDICIISIKDVEGDKLACYRQVNDSDILVLLELGDFRETVDTTIERIRGEIPHPSAIFSVNCVFRQVLFDQHGYMPTYLRQMSSLGNHAGFVGYGEHFNDRFVNQSMTCVVFE